MTAFPMPVPTLELAFSMAVTLGPPIEQGDRMWRPAQTAITAAARYAIAAKASEVQVTGFRSQIRMSDGKDFVEKDSVAENRAKDVEVALRTLGVPDSTRIKVSWRQAPVRADGIQADIQGRKVSILVMP